jgi:hypothetical protein
MQNGELVSRSGERYRVRFELINFQRNIIRRPGIGVAGGKADGTLRIESLDGSVIPENEYELFPEGTTSSMRVSNFAGVWSLVGSI